MSKRHLLKDGEHLIWLTPLQAEVIEFYETHEPGSGEPEGEECFDEFTEER